MSDLHIPDAAEAEYFTCGCDDPRCDREGFGPAALPHIVAAKLRSLANSDELLNLCDPYNGTTGDAVQEWLQQEADELDGGTS